MSSKGPPDLLDRTFQFSCNIVQYCRKLALAPGCRRIADQLLDAGTSVGANHDEAQAAYSHREFTVKICIVLKEAREAVFWLRLIAACELMAQAQTAPLLDEADQLRRIFAQSVLTARGGRR